MSVAGKWELYFITRCCAYIGELKYMFRKKTEENLLPEGDVRRMIEAIDNIASGDFNEIDATDFNNPLYADKLNS